MATTQNTYTGNGSTTNYSFTFEYIKQADVKASLDGTVTTAFTLANATTLAFNTAPASGVNIIIFRDTPNDITVATFFAGSAIKAEDLNDNFTQSLYVIQEADFSVGEANQNSEDALAKADQAAQDAQDAANDAAQSANDAAQAAADSASAEDDAADALLAANAAQVAADQAKLDAAAAKADASTAVASANSAQASAASAQASAAQANASATAALQAAQDAQASAEAALSLITDFVGTGSAYSNLYNNASGSTGSKTIDLGDLTSIASCSNSHFPNEETVGSETYNMSLGCSSINYGSV